MPHDEAQATLYRHLSVSYRIPFSIRTLLNTVWWSLLAHCVRETLCDMYLICRESHYAGVLDNNQVHRIEVTNQGIHPDPLLISVNDCVAWVWSDGEGYEVQEYSNAVNECGSARRSRDYVKRY